MFRWDVSAAAIDIRAEAYGWPVTMVEVLEQATQKASLEYTQLQRKLKADTVKLQEDIEDCSRQVSAFASLNDVNEQVWYAHIADLCLCEHFLPSRLRRKVETLVVAPSPGQFVRNKTKSKGTSVSYYLSQ